MCYGAGASGAAEETPAVRALERLQRDTATAPVEPAGEARQPCPLEMRRIGLLLQDVAQRAGSPTSSAGSEGQGPEAPLLPAGPPEGAVPGPGVLVPAAQVEPEPWQEAGGGVRVRGTPAAFLAHLQTIGGAPAGDAASTAANAQNNDQPNPRVPQG